MTKKAETRRQLRIRYRIEEEFHPHVWFFKVHGNEFQGSGIPDLIGTVHGIFFAFEVKEPDGTVEEIQEETISDIRHAGGIAAIVEEPEEALNYIREAIRWLSGKGGDVLLTGERVSTILRAGYRKNLNRPRSNRTAITKKRLARSTSD
jgi:hypothetical protein